MGSHISGAICSNEMFSCDSNKCIGQHLLCNGEKNCEDGSDETTNCTGLYRQAKNKL